MRVVQKEVSLRKCAEQTPVLPHDKKTVDLIALRDL